MTEIDDTCPGCDIHLTVTEWEIEGDELRCPDCGWTQPYKEDIGDAE